ncbi:hypothetical protein GF327_06030 [Candidatus Woesearchaeota archaeon]|nr:hypothetical protein [Candidatus Woesearchaeota archaeon]
MLRNGSRVYKMNFSEYFKQGIEIIKLNRQTIKKISTDQDATLFAFLFFAIGGVATALFGGPVAWISAGIGAVIGSIIGAGVTHILAKLFGGEGSFMELYRPLGVGSLLSWIPMLGALISLWNLVVTVITLEEVHKLSTGKAVFVVLIPVLVALVIVITLITFIAAMFAAVFGGAAAALFDSLMIQ